MIEYSEFLKTIKKVDGKRVHSINKSIGVYDIYKHIRKNKWYNIPRPITEKEFYSIIRKVNLLIAEHIANGGDFVLPYKLGTLELRKRPSRIEIVDGKLVTNLPIDWQATLKLWYTDQESMNNRVLVKQETEDIFKVCYNKTKAQYINKSFYNFRSNRSLKQKVIKQAKTGKLDAFLFQYYD